MKRRNFLGYSFLFIAGCTAIRKSKGQLSNIPMKTIRFAVTDVAGSEALKKNYGAFRTALAEVLETEVELFPVASFTEAASALQLHQVDLVLAGPSEYVIVRARTNAVPVIALTRPNLRSVIAVRAGSGIKSIVDLKGKTMEVGRVGSTSGYLGPIALLIEAGLDPQSDVELFISPEFNLENLKTGKVDAWGRGTHRYKSALENGNSPESDYLAIAESPPLPNDIFVADSQVDAETVEYIRSRMLENKDKLMDAMKSAQNFKFKDSTLAPVNDHEYDTIRAVYEAMGEGDLVK